MASIAYRWAELKNQFVSWVGQGAKDLHNHIVPAFPTYVHGVDEPGTPLNMGPDKPSFEASMEGQKPPAASQERAADKGIEP